MVPRFLLKTACSSHNPKSTVRCCPNNDLEASETVFIDDMPYNVEGAKVVGMAGIQFVDAVQCENSLRALGVNLNL